MGEKLAGEIKEIALDSATYKNTNTKFFPTYINYFFGNNGTGKSTIAKAIKNNIGITYASGRTEADYLALVYNQDFIDKNIRSYDGLPGVFTMGTIDAKTQEDIGSRKQILSEVKESISESKGNKEVKLCEQESIKKQFYKDCWDATSDLRESFILTQDGKRKAQQFTEEVLKHNPVDHDLDDLKRTYDSVYSSNAQSYPPFATVSNVSVLDALEGAQLLRKSIVNTSNTEFAEFLKKVGSTEWVRQGHNSFHNSAMGKCPYCARELPSDFESILIQSFDTQYQDDLSKLKRFLSDYRDKANELFSRLQKIPTPLYPAIDSKDYLQKLSILKQTIGLNIEKIKGKIEEPSIPVSLESTKEQFIELSEMIATFNKLIAANNDIVLAGPSKKVECTNKVFEKCAFLLQTTIANHKTEYATLEDDIQAIDKAISTNTSRIPALEQEIRDLSVGTTESETAMNNINAMLHDAGFQGFELRPKAETIVKADGSTETFIPSPPLHYQVIRPDTGLVAENLSEGEKNFIAFLYFQQLVLGSQSQEEETRSKIVVIDDPVSSMDSSALFIVSAQIRKMIEICRNNADNRNPVISGNFIKQIFILTHNAYFHREVAYAHANRYEFVSYYLIRKRDGKSSVTLSERQNPNCPTEMINVNPVKNSYAALWDEYKEINSAIPLMNVIRQILEYYFLQLCGYEGLTLRQRILEENKDKFTHDESGNEDYTKYDAAASMLSYISTESKGINDGTYFIDDSMDINLCRTTFEMIFDTMNQEQHYKMMMD